MDGAILIQHVHSLWSKMDLGFHFGEEVSFSGGLDIQG